MTDTMILSMAMFFAAASLTVLVSLLCGRRTNNNVKERLEQLAGRTAGTRHSNVWDDRDDKKRFQLATLLMPVRDEGRRRIGERLVQAGLYRRNSLSFYLTVKVLMICLPVGAGLGAVSMGLVPLRQGVIFGLIAGLVGTIVPGIWLDAQKKKRQMQLRRALPDALDVIVVCLEGGMSLSGSFAKVSAELRTAHPMLAAEMAIVQREIQMGRSTGEALKNFAERFDLEELRSLASVVLQAERFGASVVKALRVHADSLRYKRQQYAEEMAAKASVKLLLPSLCFIFPALFIVLLGPAAFDVIEMMRNLRGEG
jgi:tight adherence protein C